uniref:Methyltransferase type 11 domain-containing protein n=1 Tax=mine drainage metagenome TaxID=410659 RepID=E6Q1Z0_9ZZZZ
MTVQDDAPTRALAYSTSLYDALVEFGIPLRGRILDAACGEGDASAPLIDNGATVTGIDLHAEALDRARRLHPAATWRLGDVTALPFEAASFDAYICAQGYHLFDRTKALAEAYRVLKPGGTIAIWWKHALSGSPVRPLCDEAAREIDIHPLAGTLVGGFREFYAPPFVGQSLRVVQWRLVTTRTAFFEEERIRLENAGVAADRIDRYVRTLTQLFIEQLGPDIGSFQHAFMQYLYLARKAV